MPRRVMGAAWLDAGTYEEVEADGGANFQAAAVVVVSGLGVVIGNGATKPLYILLGVVHMVFLWLFASGVAWLIGTGLFDGDADWGELLRTMGFAQGPMVFMVFAAVPGLQLPAVLVVSIWLGMTYVTALQHALDISFGKAWVTGVLCAAIMMAREYINQAIWN